jgi:hypothetical protein
VLFGHKIRSLTILLLSKSAFADLGAGLQQVSPGPCREKTVTSRL